MNTQTKALRLADDLDQCHAGHVYEGPTIFSEAAAELRRLHEVNQELLEVLQTWARAYLSPDYSLTMKQFDAMVRAAIAKATA